MNVCTTEVKAIEYLHDLDILSTEMVCPRSAFGKRMTSDLNRCRQRCSNRTCQKGILVQWENEFCFTNRTASNDTHV